MTQKALSTCPQSHCAQKKWGKGKVKRMIGAGAGLIFKGSGFYITDYRSDSYKQAAKKDSTSTASSSDGAKTTSSGGETKSAGKPEKKSAPAKAGST